MIKAMEDRFSVRHFQDREVEQDKIDQLIEAARKAPSAKNVQPWHFVIIQDKKKRDQLTDICKGQAFVSQAPISIAVCANHLDYTMTSGEKAYTVDAVIAAEHIALEAVAQGLGTCWMGAFYADQLAELIDLPREYKVVTVLPIGYPDCKKNKRNLKPIKEIVSYDSFSE